MPNSLNSIKMPTILRFFSNDLMNALYLETQLLIIALIIDPLDDAYKSLGILLTSNQYQDNLTRFVKSCYGLTI